MLTLNRILVRTQRIVRESFPKVHLIFILTSHLKINDGPFQKGLTENFTEPNTADVFHKNGREVLTKRLIPVHSDGWFTILDSVFSTFRRLFFQYKLRTRNLFFKDCRLNQYCLLLNRFFCVKGAYIVSVQFHEKYLLLIEKLAAHLFTLFLTVRQYVSVSFYFSLWLLSCDQIQI